LVEAKALRDSIVGEAKTKASQEAERMIASAKQEIENQKKAAITDLKNQVAQLSVDIAEKLLRDKLNDADRQKALSSALAAEIKAN